MKTKANVLILIFIFLFGICRSQSIGTPKLKNGMIKVSILYQAGEGKTFDMDYYLNKHIPLLKRLLGTSLKFVTVDKGIAGGAPDSPAPFRAIGHLYFDKLSDYQTSFSPSAAEIRRDILNYTTIQPIVQISEVSQ